MSIAAITAVMDLAPNGWSSGTRLVAIALADRVNDTTGLAWPSLNELGRRTGITDPRGLRRHLRTLEADGWISRDDRLTGSGRKTSNTYRWHPPLPVLGTPPEGVPAPGVQAPGVVSAPPQAGACTPLDRVRAPGEGGAGTPTRTVSEPPTETDTEPSLTNARHSTAREATSDEIPIISCPKHRPGGRRGCAACDRKIARLAADHRARAPAARSA